MSGERERAGEDVGRDARELNRTIVHCSTKKEDHHASKLQPAAISPGFAILAACEAIENHELDYPDRDRPEIVQDG
eukprot:CAMPEP_0181244758 /NCGR_PEP_ID=MMETSP1096-20121128/43042_1 /TAXON_ID=156174 ORGANISM="Chrysochromulina ericina, Strain CCMP281" /NCGR_SAMPLE_ID=MMETSP1096 /ASSEMBLY_ACC=CAM_ASM_000453 /LENGTH=75 /DNA_ID=CAMNT_0023341351 /DNA_START=677 /DNA_END=901 /DNA_ORIENTATION=+